MDSGYLAAESERMGIRNDFERGLTEVTVRGTWDAELRSLTAHNLRACLAEYPRTVLVDLDELDDPAAESVPTWRTAAQYAATRRPLCELTLCVVPLPVRQRLDGTGIRSADSSSEARKAAKAAPWAHRRLLHLPAEPGGAGAARSLVDQACRDWDLPQLVPAAQLIISELVINAVEHARTDVIAAVSLRDRILHLAVQDFIGSLPRLLEHDPDDPSSMIVQRGAGLRLVRHASTTWGALPCKAGKVVWATLAVTAEVPST